ncbi:MAG: hypothetical protein V7K41_22305 [Nostoc sp.]|uniref:hypothetical protein n=1 Tax=Nostoc sp. TaxID=1180 RepID=UPI002FF6E2DF
MSRRKSAVELEELAKIKRAQAAAKLAEKQANPKPYTPKLDTDYIQAYYRDPLDITRVFKVKIPEGTVTLWGGLIAAGLTAAAPANTAVIEITKGSKLPIVKVRWFYGDDTAIVVPATTAHGRWIKFYDKKNGQAHHQIPFVETGATPDLATTITAFYSKLNTQGETDKIIGTRGRADLVIGYGNQYVTLARVSV